jgi:hypothetical protein
MIPLAPFIVVPDQAIPLDVSVIEPVFQAAWVMNGPRHLPENHFAQSTIRIQKTGTMEEFCNHMAHYTIAEELFNLKFGTRKEEGRPSGRPSFHLFEILFNSFHRLNHILSMAEGRQAKEPFA